MPLGPGGGDVAVVQLDGRAERARVAARRARARRRDPVEAAERPAGRHRRIAAARDQLLDAGLGQRRHDRAGSARCRSRRRAGTAAAGTPSQRVTPPAVWYSSTRSRVDLDADRRLAVGVARPRHAPTRASCAVRARRARRSRPPRRACPARECAARRCGGRRRPPRAAGAGPRRSAARLERDVRDRRVAVADVDAAVGGGRQRQRRRGGRRQAGVAATREQQRSHGSRQREQSRRAWLPDSTTSRVI